MDAVNVSERKGRAVGTRENGWCRAVPGGTGITVLAVHFSHPIPTVNTLQKAIHKVQLSHTILRARITNTSSNPNHRSFFFNISPTPTVEIKSFSASDVLTDLADRSRPTIHALVEHEMNLNPWEGHNFCDPIDVLFANLYEVEDGSVLVIRAHTAVSDRTSGGAIVKKLVDAMANDDAGDDGDDGGGNMLLPLEDLVPPELKKKALWARGIGMVGYSMNFLRSSTLPFKDAKATRVSRTVMLDLGLEETQKLLSVCNERGIKLCGVLTAAGLIAAVKSKKFSNSRSETHTIVTLSDCRKRLINPLCSNDIGFYHSAIQNLYTVNGQEDLWELSVKCFSTYLNARNMNKDLQDMADLNFLMVKAIENPGMTHSSSLRTALISVFDEPEVYNLSDLLHHEGADEYIGCSSTHGVGTSIAIFDTLKDGKLCCTCIFPSPLHSREMVQGIVDEMKELIVDGITTV